MQPIYLDHHSTTPVDPRVIEIMLPWFGMCFGNPDSRSHRYGREARDGVERARSEVARLLGARDDEIVFTSGATESITLALAGSLRGVERGAHVVTQATEHRAVLETLRGLEELGVEVTVLPVDGLGRVSVPAIEEALRPTTRIVSLMLSNNEIGTASPIAEVAALCELRGVALHVDAAQGLGYVPLDVGSVPVDLVSASAHKLYGPKGTGALFVRRFGRARPLPVFRGGGQERGLRSGTVNVPGVVGFGEAARLMRLEGTAEAATLSRLRDRLFAALATLPGMARNGDPSSSHPGNLSVRFAGISADRLLLELEPTLALSTGSACSSGGKPSHVLEAIGLDPAARRETLRIGLGRTTSEADVDAAAEAFRLAVHGIRARLDEAPPKP